METVMKDIKPIGLEERTFENRKKNEKGTYSQLQLINFHSKVKH